MPTGTDAAETFEVLPGDIVDARGGDDILNWSSYAGDRTGDGGAGVDRAEFLNVFGYSIDLQSGSVYAGDVFGGFTSFSGTIRNVENVRVGAAGDRESRVFGNASANVFTVNTFYDDPPYVPGASVTRVYFDGRGGDDSLYGAAGNDVLIGGAGNDYLSGGRGADRLNGGVGNDVISGGADADDLDGGAGNDTLDGGAGVDIMRGGAGDDVYFLDSASDVVIELADEGLDTVNVSFSLALNQEAFLHVENVTLLGDERANAVGNTLDNVLIGNDNVNALNGSHGADRMEGRGGNDLYYVDNVGDVVVELAGGGTADTVRASITYTLGDNVERLQLVGSQQINAIGNAADNVLQGNLRPNVIIGMGGRDLMTGGAGADRFDFRDVSDSAFNAYDRITDLADEDVINLSAIDADTTVAGDQAFVLASAFTGQAGQLTLTYVASGGFTVLAADVNGDRVGDFRVILDGNHTDYDNFRL